MLLDLRQQTQTHHLALHQHPILAPLQSSQIEWQQYKLALNVFYKTFHPLERALELACGLLSPEERQILAHFPSAPVVKWLEQDRAELSFLKDTESLEYGGSLGSLSEIIGYLYVKQGSTLGGQVIRRNSAHLTNKDLRGYFSGYGRETGMYWKAFTRALLAYQNHLKSEQVIATAQQVFIFFLKTANQLLGELNSEICSARPA